MTDEKRNEQERDACLDMQNMSLNQIKSAAYRDARF